MADELKDSTRYTLSKPDGRTLTVDGRDLGRAIAKGWHPLDLDTKEPEEPSFFDQAWDMGGRGLAGLGRAAAGIIEAPGQLYKAASMAPQDPYELQLAKEGFGPLAMAAHRTLVDPLMELGGKAQQLEQKNKGMGVESTAYRLASGIPILGPLAANIGERMGKGDIIGATTEGIGYALAPKVGKLGVGAIAKGLGIAPTVAKLEGIEVPRLKSEAAPETTGGTIVQRYRSRGIGRENFIKFAREQQEAAREVLRRAAQATVDQVTNDERPLAKSSRPSASMREAATFHEEAAKPLYEVLNKSIELAPEQGEVMIAKVNNLMNKFFADEGVDKVRNPQTGEIFSGMETSVSKLPKGTEFAATGDRLLEVRSEIGKAANRAKDPNMRRRLHELQGYVDEAIEQSLEHIDQTVSGQVRMGGGEFAYDIKPQTFKGKKGDVNIPRRVGFHDPANHSTLELHGTEDVTASQVATHLQESRAKGASTANWYGASMPLVDTWRMARKLWTKRSTLMELSEALDKVTKGTPIELQKQLMASHVQIRPPEIMGQSLVKRLAAMDEPTGSLTQPGPSRLEQLFGATPSGRLHINYIRQAAELIAEAQRSSIGSGAYRRGMISNALEVIGGRRLSKAMTSLEGAKNVLDMLRAPNTSAFDRAVKTVAAAAASNSDRSFDDLEHNYTEPNPLPSHPPTLIAPQLVAPKRSAIIRRTTGR